MLKSWKRLARESKQGAYEVSVRPRKRKESAASGEDQNEDLREESI